MKSKRLTEKQKRLIIDKRLWAAEELAKRYLNIKELITDELIQECLAVIKQEKVKYGQKKAARIILNIKYGAEKTNDLIEHFAVVTDGNDSLVRRWRNKVIERDKCCQECGNTYDLHAHHIVNWADDPINRINVDNGITLCRKCHANYHAELSNFILSRGGD